MTKYRLKRPLRFTVFVCTLITTIVFPVIAFNNIAYTKGTTTTVTPIEVSTPEVTPMPTEEPVIIPEPIVIPVETMQKEETVNESDVLLLAAALTGEADICSENEIRAIAEVVLNRAKHWNINKFGGPTIKGVLTKNNQVQATNKPGWEKRIDPTCLKVAKEVLSVNYTIAHKDVLYYTKLDAEDQRFVKSLNIQFGFKYHVFGTLKSREDM